MGKAPITSLAELDELRREHSGPKGRSGRVRRHGSSSDRQVSQSVQTERMWQIPPPAEGATYSAADVARITGVSEATVRGWVCRGLKVSGGEVKLQTLRAPRGRITPAALCVFLETVNGVKVLVRET